MSEEVRFEFGKNWQKFMRRNFTQERCDVSKRHLLQFIGRESLAGLDFLDIGCGSGLHSLAAYQAGAARIHSFDYDVNSVEAAKMARRYAGDPENWTVERGDILDEDYVAKLGQWNFVYSWGVLHHTGNVWEALRNAQSTVAHGGMLYVALYSSDVAPPEVQKFWLQRKQEYNSSNVMHRFLMIWWYIWTYMLQKDIKNLSKFLRHVVTQKRKRGMNVFADIRDWLGGWPMEYVTDQQVVDLLEHECGFQLTNVATGEANSEFLFRRTGTPARKTTVAEMVAAKKAEAGQKADEAAAA